MKKKQIHPQDPYKTTKQNIFHIKSTKHKLIDREKARKRNKNNKLKQKISNSFNMKNEK